MSNHKMDDYLNNLEPYWSKRYRNESKIWGDVPSNTAQLALKVFRKSGVKNILVPGSGYGRHTKLFSSSGFNVTGMEISREACSIAEKNDPKTKIFEGSTLDIGFGESTFDAIYCFNLLHLFRAREREEFIDKCHRELKTNGICFFVVFSEDEESYGKGNEIEKDTFESKPGRPVHYFSENDLRNHFRKFELMEEGIVDDAETHGDIGYHVHRLRYIVCRKV